MYKDPIVDEVRRNREQIAEKFDHDLEAIYKAAVKKQKAGNKRLISFASDSQPRAKRPTASKV